MDKHVLTRDGSEGTTFFDLRVASPRRFREARRVLSQSAISCIPAWRFHSFALVGLGGTGNVADGLVRAADLPQGYAIEHMLAFAAAGKTDRRYACVDRDSELTTGPRLLLRRFLQSIATRHQRSCLREVATRRSSLQSSRHNSPLVSALTLTGSTLSPMPGAGPQHLPIPWQAQLLLTVTAHAEPQTIARALSLSEDEVTKASKAAGASCTGANGCLFRGAGTSEMPLQFCTTLSVGGEAEVTFDLSGLWRGKAGR